MEEPPRTVVAPSPRAGSPVVEVAAVEREEDTVSEASVHEFTKIGSRLSIAHGINAHDKKLKLPSISPMRPDEGKRAPVSPSRFVIQSVA